jgi:murein DD-endopeptidase MepM/ murein hydrolase activator NlpD
LTARRWRILSTRSVAVLLGVLMLATVEVWSAAPAHGRDLSGPITAVRAGQIAAEASMRSADKQLKTLKRRSKTVARRLRKARRRHADAVDQRAVARAQVRAARGQLATAHDALERQRDALVASAAEHDLLRVVAGPAAASAALALDAVSGNAQGGPEVEPRLPHTESTSAALARLQSSVDDLEGDVARLQGFSHRVERSARKVERKTRRARRREQAAKHRVREVKAGIRSAIGQQHGSEASLAGYIHSMTRLAHLRAKKKTKGKERPDFMMPVQARLTQGYHAGHDGIDLAASQGTPIRAMGPGVIAYVGWNPWDSRPRAFVVVIAHQGGFETKYGHLVPRRRVTLGKLVRRGEVIGYMGDTGHSTGVHLHLEVSRGFHTMNPYSVL